MEQARFSTRVWILICLSLVGFEFFRVLYITRPISQITFLSTLLAFDCVVFLGLSVSSSFLPMFVAFCFSYFSVPILTGYKG